MDPYDFYANDGDTLFFFDEVNGDYAIYVNDGNGWEIFGSLDLPDGMEPADVVANGPDWAMDSGADLEVISVAYIGEEPEPTDESSFGSGTEGEGSIDWSDSSAESGAEGGSSEDGSSAGGTTGEEGTGSGTGEEGDGTGDGPGEGDIPGDGADGLSDSQREALQDAVDAYESAYDAYTDARDDYESAVGDAESIAGEIEGLGEEAESLADDIGDLVGDLEDYRGAYEESFDAIGNVLGTSVEAYSYGESLGGASLSEVGAPGDGANVDDAASFPETAAEPVALFSGAYWHHAVDVRIPSLGLPLEISRRYSNQTFSHGSFGMKWDTWLDAHVRVLSSGAVYVWTGDARGVFYMPDGEGGFAVPESERARLEKSGSRYRLVDGVGVTRTFDADGRLAQVSDRFGNTIRVSRDADGHPTAVRDAVGRTLTLTIDDGHITAIADWVGRTWTYEYRNDELRAATAPATAAHPSGSRTEYTYDSGDDPRTRHNLIAIENALGDTIVENTYGQSGSRLNRVTLQEFTGETYSFDYEVEEDLPAILDHVNQLSRRTTVTDPGGVRTEYEFDPLGNLLTQRVLASDGTYETTHTYDAMGHHQEIREPSGHAQQFSYDIANADPLARHNLLEVRSVSSGSDPDLVTTVKYGAYNQVASLTDPSGVTITYELDSLGRATSVVGPDVTLADGTTLATVSTLSYRSDGQVTSMVTPEGVTHAWTYYTTGTRRGLLRRHDVDGLAVESFTHDELWRLTTLTDAAGEAWTIEYDEQDHTVAERGPTDVGAAIEYTYDVAGRLTERRERIVSADGVPASPEWSVTSYVLDERGRPTEIAQDLTATLTASVAVAWRHDDQPSQVTDATGMVTRYTYEDRGLLASRRTGHGTSRVAEEAWDYGPHGLPISYRDPLGNETAFAYDGHLRLQSTTDALGEQAVYSWRAAGPIDGYEWYDGDGVLRAEEQFTIDELGRISQIRERVIDADGAHAGWLRQRAVFDGHGRTTRVIGSSGAEMAFEYDAFDRPVRVEDPAGSVVVLTRDDAGRVTHLLEQVVDGATGDVRNFERSFDYDAMGRLRRTTDGLGNVTAYERDSRGLLTAIIQPGGTRLEFEYDLAGRLVAQSLPWTDADGGTLGTATTSYDYDAQGRLTALTDPLGGTARIVRDQRGDVTSVQLQDGTVLASFTYDEASNPLTQGDARGVTSSLDYDALWRPTRRTITLAGGATGPTAEAYAYDALGYLATATNDEHTVTLRHDSIGRVWSESLDGREVSRDWMTNGLLRSETFAGLVTARTSWDAAARLEQIRLSGVASGFPGGSTTGVLATLTHQGGHPSTIALRNGVTSTHTLDAAARLTSIVSAHGTDEVEALYALRDADGHVQQRLRAGVESRALSFDAAGRIARSVEGAAGPAPDLSDIVPGTGSSTSAAGDQADIDALATALAPAMAETTTTYEYDRAGNRAAKVEDDGTSTSTTAYTYDTAHRLRTVDGGAIVYDAVGNVTADGTRTYTYDAANRLRSVTRIADGVVILEFTYDTLGRVASVTTESGRRGLLYSGLDRVAEFDSSGACDRLWVPGPWLDRPLARFEGGTGHYPLFDHVGTLLSWTDASGAVTERHVRDEFGAWRGALDGSFASIADPDVDGDAGFQGLPAFSAAGHLHHYRARAYQPEWGLFLQPDPIGFRAGHQLYPLGFGNPQTWIDPTGEIPPLVIAIAAGALIGAAIAAWANWDKEGADFWVAVGAGALGGAIMGTGFGVASFAAGGAVSGLIVGGWEGYKIDGWRGAAIGGGFGATFGGAAGAAGGYVGQRIGTAATGYAVSRLSARLGPGAAYTVGSWSGAGLGGASGGSLGGGIGSFGLGTGLGIAQGYDIDDSLRAGAAAVPPGMLYGGVYGIAGGVGTKALMQGGFYYNTRTQSGVHGAEGEWFVRNATGQRMNTSYQTPEGKVPDLWGNVKGDVKNTQRIPSLNAQRNQLRSFLNDIRGRGETMRLYHRPGVTAGPRSQVGRAVGAGQIELRSIPHWAHFPAVWQDGPC